MTSSISTSSDVGWKWLYQKNSTIFPGPKWVCGPWTTTHCCTNLGKYFSLMWYRPYNELPSTHTYRARPWHIQFLCLFMSGLLLMLLGYFIPAIPYTLQINPTEMTMENCLQFSQFLLVLMLSMFFICLTSLTHAKPKERMEFPA